MSRIAFIGQQNLSKMLKLQGIDPFPCETGAEAEKAIEDIFSKEEHLLVFLTEHLAIQIAGLNKILTNPRINVMIIPDNRGGGELGSEKIEQLVKFALGGEIKWEK